MSAKYLKTLFYWGDEKDKELERIAEEIFEKCKDFFTWYGMKPWVFYDSSVFCSAPITKGYLRIELYWAGRIYVDIKPEIRRHHPYPYRLTFSRRPKWDIQFFTYVTRKDLENVTLEDDHWTVKFLGDKKGLLNFLKNWKDVIIEELNRKLCSVALGRL